MSWELSLVLKATVLLGAALIVAGFSSRMRASRRHLVLASALAALIALPLASVVIPSVAVSLPIASHLPPLPDAPSSQVRAETAPSPRLGTDSPQTRNALRLSPALLLQALWSFGAITLVLALAGSLWHLRRLQRSATPWTVGQLLVDSMTREAGMHRTVTVALHARASMPATMGVVRPMILLPPDARQWSESDLRRVLIHELEHVRRGDWWTHLVARTICIAYWFHPLAWMAWRQLGILAERACDDAVVARMDETDYAEQLVTFAARLSRSPRLMLSMATRTALSVRVTAILNPHQQRGRAGAVATALIVSLVGLFVGSVASLQAVVAQMPHRDGHPLSRPAAIDATLVPGQHAHPVAATTERRTMSNATAIARGRAAATMPTTPLRPEPPALSAQAPAPAVSSPPTTETIPYVIGVGDVLTIVTWHDQTLSADAIVRPDGKISLPLANEIQAAGLTPEQLRLRVTASLGLYITNPAVSVQVKEIRSRRVFVIGQVSKPGVYLLDHSMTVLQLLAEAGGLTNFARTNAIAITRQLDGRSISLPFDYSAVVKGQQLDQNIMLMPGDTIVVP